MKFINRINPDTRFYLRDFLFIPVFWSLCLCWFFFNDATFSFHAHSNFSLSIATAENVDIASRVRTFYAAIACFTISLIGLSMLLKRLAGYFLDQSRDILNGTSFAGIVLFFFQLIGSDLRPSLYLLIAIQGSALVLNLYSVITGKKPAGIGTFSWSVMVALCLYVFQWQACRLADIRPMESIPLFVLVVTSVTGILSAGGHRTFRRLVRSTFPLALLPFVSWLAVETALVFNSRGIYSAGPSLFFWLYVLLIAVWIILRLRKNFIRISVHEYLFRYWAPWLLTGIGALAYSGIVVHPEPDWFEDGNRLLPVQQLFEFGKIPFIHTFSSHAFSDFYTGLIYSIFNGYDAMGHYVYFFFIHVIIIVTVYYFLYRFLGDGYMAFFLALLFPYTDFLIPAYFNIIPLSALTLIAVYRKQSTGNYFFLFGLTIFMIFWRIDMGLANLFATAGAFLLMIFFVPSVKINRRSLLKGLSLVVIPLFLVFLLLLVVYRGEFTSAITSVLSYTSSLQAFGLPALAYSHDIKYYVLYFVMPCSVILILFFILFRLRKNAFGITDIPKAIALIFFALFYFVNFQRGLIRHTLAEGWDTALTSYGFFIMASVFLVTGLKKSFAYSGFIAASVILLVSFKAVTPSLTKNNRYHAFILRINEPEALPDFSRKVDRIHYTADADRYRELKNWMDKNISGKATFLDFTNTPLLYHFTGRRLPGYFCQPPHAAHNDFLQAKLIEDVKRSDVPVVLFSNVPPGFWDRLDGIPNTLRHGKLSEFIFNNYSPAFILDRHAIWLRNDMQKNGINSDTVWASESWSNAILSGCKIAGDILECGADPVVSWMLPGITETGKYFLVATLKAEKDGEMKILSPTDPVHGNSQETMTLHPGNNNIFLMLTQPGQTPPGELSFRLPSNSRLKIEGIRLIRCDHYPEHISTKPEIHDLKWLPIHEPAADTTGLGDSLKVSGPVTANAGTRRFIQLDENQNEDYIIVNAKTSSENEPVMTLGYGRTERTEGGFSFRLKNDGKVHSYLLRANSQYNWYKNNISWLSVFSADADVEVTSVYMTRDEDTD